MERCWNWQTGFAGNEAGYFLEGFSFGDGYAEGTAEGVSGGSGVYGLHFMCRDKD